MGGLPERPQSDDPFWEPFGPDMAPVWAKRSQMTPPADPLRDDVVLAPAEIPRHQRNVRQECKKLILNSPKTRRRIGLGVTLWEGPKRSQKDPF